MSLFTSISTWDELIDFLKRENPPQCFTVNYIPAKDNYDIWIGNQPYYSYEKLIELEEKDREKIRRKFDQYKKLAEQEQRNIKRALNSALHLFREYHIPEDEYSWIRSLVEKYKEKDLYKS
ncbi:hypothetical protein SFC65_19975 [Priestia filamentosa]|uniref:hypothetical protein n=1 Tax=Priestia filamentosa TaxID=1402861 RepID=UPI003981EAFA